MEKDLLQKIGLPLLLLLALIVVLVLWQMTRGRTAQAIPTPENPTPTPTSEPVSGPQPLGIPGAWRLVFADEFDGMTLNLNDWWPNWVNGTSPTEITAPVNTAEAAAYDPAQVTLSDGYLNLTLIDSPVTIGDKTYPYRSGMVQTNGHIGDTPMHQFTFGAFEARINLPPSGNRIANWPAWWTDGQNWPTDGEMDIMEGLSGNAQYHFHSDLTGAGGGPGGDFSGWHTYGANWQNNRVDFYYDGVLIGSEMLGITGSPMYLILNYAAGGCCSGAIVVPATMQVDYVRVWQ